MTAHADPKVHNSLASGEWVCLDDNDTPVAGEFSSLVHTRATGARNRSQLFLRLAPMDRRGHNSQGVEVLWGQKQPESGVS